MQKRFGLILAATMIVTVPSMVLGVTMAQPNSVNSAAIVDGAVTNSDIANLAITSGKIANGAVTASQIANGTITSTQLANGAVTASKLGIVCTTGQTLQYTSTGWVCSEGTPGPMGPQGIQGPAAHYANVIIVAKSGGDFTDPIAAINSVTDASESNPYLIKIMPGVYGISTTLTAKNYVDIEGSGRNTTKIIGNTTNAYSFGVVNIPSSNTEIRNLTIENGVDGTSVVAISGTSSKLNNVTVKSSVAGANTYGVNAYWATSAILKDTEIVVNGSSTSTGLVTGNSDLLLNNVKINVTGSSAYGISCGNSTISIDNGKLNVSIISGGDAKAIEINNNCSMSMSSTNIDSSGFGVHSTGVNSTTKILNTKISGWVPIFNYGNSTLMSIANTNIVGLSSYTVDSQPGTVKCFNNFDSNFTGLACP